MTIDIPNELARRLNPFKYELPQLLERGLHDYNLPKVTSFQGINEILEFLAKLPSPEEILALKPTQELQLQIETLLEKKHHQPLNSIEEQQWQQYEYLEHLIRIAKTHALLKLNAKNK